MSLVGADPPTRWADRRDSSTKAIFEKIVTSGSGASEMAPRSAFMGGCAMPTVCIEWTLLRELTFHDGFATRWSSPALR